MSSTLDLCGFFHWVPLVPRGTFICSNPSRQPRGNHRAPGDDEGVPLQFQNGSVHPPKPTSDCMVVARFCRKNCQFGSKKSAAKIPHLGRQETMDEAELQQSHP